MPSRSIEDYIKTIHRLEAQHERATTQQIADQLGVRMASVTGMVKHLAAEGYVDHQPYRGAVLTEKGRGTAIELIRRHRLIELFLVETLGFSWDEVDEDAEVLEHVVSEKLIEKIDAHLGHPRFDPHGAPIPRKDGVLPPSRGVTLCDLDEGQEALVTEVSDRDPEFLRYLTSLDIEIGSRLRILERAPYQGPITLQLDTRTIAIGRDAAQRIRVTSDRSSASE